MLAGLGALVVAAIASAGPYEDAINKADQAVKNGHYLEGAEAARSAITLDAKRFEGYYYAAFCLLKRDMAREARPFAASALRLAGEEDKPQVQKLVDAIESHERFMPHLKAADEAFEQGLLAKAAREYAAAYREYPSRGDVGMKAAKLYSERLVQPMEAAQILQQLAKGNDLDEVREARTMLKLTEPQLSPLVDAKVREAKRFLEMGRPDQAADAVLPAAQAMPERTEPHSMLAEAYAMSGKTELVKKEIIALASISANDAGKELSDPQYAYTFREAGFVAFVRDLLGEEPAKRLQAQQEIEYLYQEGSTKALLGHTDEGIADLTRAIELRPDDCRGYYFRGVAKARLDVYPQPKLDLDGAIDDFGVSISKNDKYADAYRHRAEARLARAGSHDIEDAISDLSRLIELKPGDTSAYYSRGEARMRQGDFDGAIEDLNRHIEINKKNDRVGWLPYNGLGLAHAARRRYNEALADFDHAIGILDRWIKMNDAWARSGALAYLNRGSIRFILQDYDAAIEDNDRALSMSSQPSALPATPDVSSAYLYRAASKEAKGDFRGALADYEKYIAVAPKDSAEQQLQCCLLRRRLGETVELPAPGGGTANWTSRNATLVLRFYAGEISETALLDAANSAAEGVLRNNDRCEMNYFIALWRLTNGDGTAQQRFRDSVATNDVTAFLWYNLAAAELSRLNSAHSPGPRPAQAARPPPAQASGYSFPK